MKIEIFGGARCEGKSVIRDKIIKNILFSQGKTIADAHLVDKKIVIEVTKAGSLTRKGSGKLIRTI